MSLPRGVSGSDLASLLRRYGYQVTRQTGSHLRLTPTAIGPEHHVTVRAHRALKVGTLSGILSEIATYLEKDRTTLLAELWGR